jgi:hypothetical protein
MTEHKPKYIEQLENLITITQAIQFAKAIRSEQNSDAPIPGKATIHHAILYAKTLPAFKVGNVYVMKPLDFQIWLQGYPHTPGRKTESEGSNE